LTLKIFFDSSHDWESFFFQTQVINSLFATNSKNRMRIDRFAYQTNAVVSSSHKSFLSSAIIDSFADVWALSADSCIC
jgi:hypothetical protein